MEDLDLSSDTFDTDTADEPKPVQKTVVNMETVLNENQRLQHLNNQLTESLEQLKSQLKDALDAASTSQSVSGQIQILKTQLADANEKKEKAIRDYKDTTTLLNETISKLTADLDKATVELVQIKERVHEQETTITKLKKDRQFMKQQDIEKEEMLIALTEALTKEKSQKKKFKNRTVTLTDENLILKNKVDASNNAVKVSGDEKDALRHEIDDLSFKLETLNDQIMGLTESNGKLITSNATKDTAIEKLQKQISSQQIEIESYENNRQVSSSYLAQLYSTTFEYEKIIAELTKQNAALKSQIETPKEKATVSQVLSQASILDIRLPFHGEIKDSLEKIMNLPQYSPIQRLQLIFNEVGKNYDALSAEIADLKRDKQAEKEHQDEKSEQKYRSLLFNFLRELKNLAVTDVRIHQSGLCGEDDSFINFISQKSAEIDPELRDKVTSSPEFIPNDFFTTMDIKSKKEVIADIVGRETVQAAIFTSCFLTNIILKKQLEEVMGPLNQYEELSRMSIAHGADIVDLPEIVKNQKEQIEKLTSSRKQLHDALKKSRSQQMLLIKTDNEQKSKISALQLQNDTLKQENDVLRVKTQVLNNELLLKSNECGTLSEIASQIKENVEDRQNSVRERNEKLEKELRAKTNECIELTGILKSLQNVVNESGAQQAKRYKKQEEAYIKQIEQMEAEYAQLLTKTAEKNKRTRKNIKALKAQYETALSDLSKGFEEQRNTLESTIASLTEKVNEARENKIKATEASNAAQAKLEKAEKEIASLGESVRELNLQLASLKQSASREKQQLQTKLTAQTLNAEAKLHESEAELQAEFQHRMDSVLQSISSTIGKFYGIAEDDFNEESLATLVIHAKGDLEKLKYFQTQAILPEEERPAEEKPEAVEETDPQTQNEETK